MVVPVFVNGCIVAAAGSTQERTDGMFLANAHSLHSAITSRTFAVSPKVLPDVEFTGRLDGYASLLVLGKATQTVIFCGYNPLHGACLLPSTNVV